jgi:hypothetical protein
VSTSRALRGLRGQMAELQEDVCDEEANICKEEQDAFVRGTECIQCKDSKRQYQGFIEHCDSEDTSEQSLDWWGGVAYWSNRPRVQLHCGGADLWSRRGPGFKPALGQMGSS